MAPPWPQDPDERAQALKKLHDRYRRIFVNRSSNNTVNTKTATSSNPVRQKESFNIQQHHIQNFTFIPENKDINQLKKEAQFKRMRLTQQTHYSLEPTFMIPDSITCVPKSEVETVPETHTFKSEIETVPEIHILEPEKSTSISLVNQKTIEKHDQIPNNEFKPHNSNHDTMSIIQELEIQIRPEEQFEIEQNESEMQPVPTESIRKQKKRLWVSRIKKRKN